MGVKGLWKLLEPTGRPVSLEAMEGKVLAVDVSIWLNQAMYGMQGIQQSRAHLVVLFNRICKLLYYKIKPIFVFDGAAPELKKHTLNARRKRKELAVARAQRATERIVKNYLRSHALNAVSKGPRSKGRKAATLSNMTSRNEKEASLFELPPIPENMKQSTRTILDEKEDLYLDRIDQQRAVEAQYEDLDEIDIQSEEFRGLSEEIQHEIITNIRGSRRKPFWSRYKELPKKADDFSSYQLSRLLKKGKMSHRLDELQKDMKTKTSGDLSILLDYETRLQAFEAGRVASEDTQHYVLITKNEQQLGGSSESLDSDRPPTVSQAQRGVDEDMSSHADIAGESSVHIGMDLESYFSKNTDYDDVNRESVPRGEPSHPRSYSENPTGAISQSSGITAPAQTEQDSIKLIKKTEELEQGRTRMQGTSPETYKAIKHEVWKFFNQPSAMPRPEKGVKRGVIVDEEEFRGTKRAATEGGVDEAPKRLKKGISTPDEEADRQRLGEAVCEAAGAASRKEVQDRASQRDGDDTNLKGKSEGSIALGGEKSVEDNTKDMGVSIPRVIQARASDEEESKLVKEQPSSGRSDQSVKESVGADKGRLPWMITWGDDNALPRRKSSRISSKRMKEVEREAAILDAEESLGEQSKEPSRQSGLKKSGEPQALEEDNGKSEVKASGFRGESEVNLSDESDSGEEDVESVGERLRTTGTRVDGEEGSPDVTKASRDNHMVQRPDSEELTKADLREDLGAGQGAVEDKIDSLDLEQPVAMETEEDLMVAKPLLKEPLGDKTSEALGAGQGAEGAMEDEGDSSDVKQLVVMETSKEDLRVVKPFLEESSIDKTLADLGTSQGAERMVKDEGLSLEMEPQVLDETSGGGSVEEQPGTESVKGVGSGEQSVEAQQRDMELELTATTAAREVDIYSSGVAEDTPVMLEYIGNETDMELELTATTAAREVDIYSSGVAEDTPVMLEYIGNETDMELELTATTAAREVDIYSSGVAEDTPVMLEYIGNETDMELELTATTAAREVDIYSSGVAEDTPVMLEYIGNETDMELELTATTAAREVDIYSSGVAEDTPVMLEENSSDEEMVIENQEIEAMQENLAAERFDLERERSKGQKLAASVTEAMYTETKELLVMFGIPYIESPQEAEAQCAYLDMTGQCQGTITDDSDVWLFGGQRVYKNFFTKDREVLFFHDQSVERQLTLDRHKMINLGLLLGSDYTIGVQGVGAVTAMEILSEFPGQGIEGLEYFREWWQTVKDFDLQEMESKVRAKLTKLHLPPDFPSSTVVRAYLDPEVDKSAEKFTWMTPDLDLLRTYAEQKLGWIRSKTDDILLPVMKRMREKVVQGKISSYFFLQPNVDRERQKIQSKRVQEVLKKLSGASPEQSEPDPAAGRKLPDASPEQSDESATTESRTETKGRKQSKDSIRKGLEPVPVIESSENKDREEVARIARGFENHRGRHGRIGRHRRLFAKNNRGIGRSWNKQSFNEERPDEPPADGDDVEDQTSEPSGSPEQGEGVDHRDVRYEMGRGAETGDQPEDVGEKMDHPDFDDQDIPHQDQETEPNLPPSRSRNTRKGSSAPSKRSLKNKDPPSGIREESNAGGDQESIPGGPPSQPSGMASGRRQRTRGGQATAIPQGDGKNMNTLGNTPGPRSRRGNAARPGEGYDEEYRIEEEVEPERDEKEIQIQAKKRARRNPYLKKMDNKGSKNGSLGETEGGREESEKVEGKEEIGSKSSTQQKGSNRINRKQLLDERPGSRKPTRGKGKPARGRGKGKQLLNRKTRFKSIQQYSQLNLSESSDSEGD